MDNNFNPISKIKTAATLGSEISKIHKKIYTESSICKSNSSNSLHIKEVQLCEADFLRFVNNNTSMAELVSSSKSSNPVERSNDFEFADFLDLKENIRVVAKGTSIA